MRIFYMLLLMFSISTCTIAQMRDTVHVKNVLTQEKPLGWIFNKSKSLNYSNKSGSYYYFNFKANDSLYVFSRKVNSKSEIVNSSLIYKTTYKILSLEHGQFGVRIFNFEPRIEMLLGPRDYKKNSIDPFSDFNLVMDSQKKILTLRLNTPRRQTGYTEYEFK